MPLSPDDVRFMETAIELARRCTSEPGKVSPKVGAVVVKDGDVVAHAYRGELAPGEHAEFTALKRKAAHLDLSGSTVYTTLEPCTSRNPPKTPCARHLIDQQVARVVVGMLDPDPRIAGSGVNALQAMGVVVDLVPPDQAKALHDMNAQWVGKYTDLRQPWRELTSMSLPRERHAAVPFLNGVLVVGGFVSGSRTTAECELFDSESERWLPFPPLSIARAGHTATVLRDGSVFAFGGITPSAFLASAEVLSLDSTEWLRLGDAPTALYGHSATLLRDGRILICGGYSNPTGAETGTFSAVAQVFDPKSKQWDRVGDMRTPRDGHTATLLPDGRVLVAGGRILIQGTRRHVSLLETEFFEPRTGTWTPGPAMSAARARGVAVWLRDNRLLVAGGTSECACCRSTVLNTAEAFSMDAGAWTSVGPMQAAREMATAFPLTGGGALVMGGVAGTGEIVPLTERFDLVSSEWIEGPKMLVPRMCHSVVSLGDGRVLVAGGLTNHAAERKPTARVEVFQHQ